MTFYSRTALTLKIIKLIKQSLMALKTTYTYVIFFLLLSIQCFSQLPSLGQCNRIQHICLSGSTNTVCTKITVPSGQPAITKFEVRDVDGNVIRTIPFSQVAQDINLTFNFEGFYNTCTYKKTVFMDLHTFYTDSASSKNIITPFYFYNPPQLNFTAPPTSCVGSPVSVSNNSCPMEGLSNFQWNFGDDNVFSTNTQHTYRTANTYTITMKATYKCGEGESSEIQTKKQITIIDIAKAKANVLSGTSSASPPYLVCLSGGGTVQVTGRNSISTTFHQWSVSPSSGITFSPRYDTVLTNITFTREGNYTVILRADNECQKPSFDTLIFRVVSAEALRLNHQNDGCTVFTYRPQPLIVGATYERFLDGVSQGQFDPTVGFSAGFGKHKIIARLQNECGNQIQPDSFLITPAEPVFFLKPSTDTTVCLNSNMILLMVTPKGGTVSGSNSLIIRGDSIFFNPSQAGSFTLTYKRGSPTECERIATRKITVSATESLTLNQQAPRCQPFLYKPSPIVAGAIYKINGVVFDPNIGIQVDTGTHVVTATLINLCDSVTIPMTFRVRGIDVLRVYSHDSIVCRQGTPVRLYASQGVTWTGPNGSIVGDIFYPLLAGFDTHTLTASIGQGECANSMSIKLTIQGIPNVKAGKDTAICKIRNSQPILLNQGRPLGGVYYLNNPFTGQRVTEIDPSVLAAGVYKIYYVLSDTTQSLMCPSYDSLTIAINDIPTASAQLPTSACVGINTPFEALNSMPTQTYQWFVNDTLVGSSARFNYVFRYDGLMHITLLVSNPANCNATFKQDIMVRRAPRPSFRVSQTEICSGKWLNIVNETFLNDETTVYKWRFRGAMYNQNQIDSLLMTNIGCTDSIYTLTLLATTGLCTEVSFEKNITVFPRITARIGGIQGQSDSVCSNRDVQFINHSCGKIKRYIWNINGQEFIGREPPIQNFTNETDTVKHINISLIVEGADDCNSSDTAYYRLGVYPLNIRARFTFQKSAGCAPFTVNFRSLTPFASGFLYFFGDSTMSDSPNIVKVFYKSGIYPVKFRTYHPCGGFSEYIDTISVWITPTTKGLTYEKVNQCDAYKIRIKPIVQNGVLVKVWADSATVLEQSANPILNFTHDGTFMVRYTVKNIITNCEQTDSGLVVVGRALTLSAIVKLADRCGVGEGSISLTAVGGSGNYRFATQDSVFSFTDPIFPRLFGQKTYTYYVRDTQNCIASIAVFLPGRDSLHVNVGRDLKINMCDSVRLQAAVNIPNKMIQKVNWLPLGSCLITDCSITTVRPTKTTLYKVIVTDTLGCSAADSVLIDVNEAYTFFDPNVFSPNGDGNDDVFYLQGNDCTIVNIKRFRIITEWGNLVYERFNIPINNADAGWNGQFGNIPMGAGVYKWFAELTLFNGDTVLKNGNITLQK